MSIQEPAWLKRTRPCPFFSQGRCLFADSCNFLHDVKIRSAVNQPLLSTTVKQPPLPPKPVFHPPSVVINSASPNSVNLASPQSPESSTQNSSRYSGLLSVLSDVIGPPSNPPTANDAIPPRTVSAISSSFQSPVHGRTGLPSESDPVVVSFEPTSDASGIEMEQGAPRHAEPPSIPEPDSETTSVDPFRHQMEFFPPAADDALLAEFLPVPDHEESDDGDATSYFVETYILEPPEAEEESGDDEDMGGCGEDDPTVMVSNRQSTFSSFTGASLLASPRRHSIFGDAASPIEDHGTVDLLSPVQLSTNLRPFPIPSLGSRVKRGDSIDSGYADGDSWVGPLPFPRSPPGSFQSPVTFPSHSGRASLSFSSLKARRVSYDAIALRASPYNPIEVTKEVENSEDNEDTKYTILGAYDTPPSGEQGEGGACDPLQVNVMEEKINEADRPPSEVPAVVRSPRRYSPKHLHPTREYDLDSCNQPSFTSDDNVSFKTALSTQPSYEDLSDISRVSPVEQDSLLSSISYRSTSDTSVLSHYGDTNGLLGESIVDSHVRGSSFLVATTSMGCQIDSTEALKIRASEECPLAEEVAIDSNTPFVPASAEDLRGLASEKVVAPRRSLTGVFHFDRCSPISGPSVDTSHDLSSVKEVLSCVPLGTIDLRKLVLEKAFTPRERLSGAFHFDRQPLRSNPSAKLSHPSVKIALSSAPPSVGGHQKPGPEHVTPPQELLPSISRYDRHSPKSTEESYSLSDVLGCTPADASDVQESDLQKRPSGVLHFDKRSPKPSSFAESPCSLSSVKNIPSYASQGVDGRQEKLLADVVVPRERLPGGFHFEKHLPKLSSPAESSYCSSYVKDVPAEHDAVGAGQSPLVENNLGPDEIVEYLDSEGDSSAQPLSFSLPFSVPDEIVGQPTLSGEEDTEATSAALEKDAPNAYVVSQDEEMQRVRSGFDLTEKARPSQLPLVGSPDFTLRRSRAASDLTVKANSPLVTTPGDAPSMLRSPPPLEQLGRSDSVQSLYDQYFDDGTSDDHSLSSGPVHKDTASPDMSSRIEEPSQEVNLQSLDFIPHIFRGVPSPSSDGKPGNSGTDSPRSETILRPLLTGRRSFLRSSLAEFIPKANFANHKGTSSPTYASPRLQAKVIGSTMVPLGFRRHKPQPAVTQSLRSASQSLHTVRPASELREVLRIRTDITREDSPPGCSSANHVSFPTRSPSPAKAMSAPPTGGLKRLRLSTIINKRSSILSTHSSSIAPSILSLDHTFNPSAPQSPTVSSITSFSRNSSLSSSCEQIPEQIHHTLERSSSNTLILQPNDDACFAPQSSSTGRDSRSVSPPIQQPKSWRLSCYRAGSRNYTSADSTRRFSRRTSTLSLSYAVAEEQEIEDDSTIPHPIQSKYTDDWTRPASVLAAPVHAIATPKPTLLFAIASDDVDQVRQVLENGEAGPNDSVGPQSALAFTLTNDKLTHKQEIVKALLAYGANPSALRNPTLNPAPRIEGGDEPSGPPPETTSEGMDPATRYFVARADAAHTRQTSQLIYRSFFRPLTRVRYDVIGQDWALEQLFRVLSIHSQKLAVAPIVVLLCGPSGHGKSLLARKFGSLVDVPTHTVNMTTLRSTHDIWQSYSMSPYEEPSSCTLAEFLIENEGKRCVVVLDEIEKVEDQKALWSLLMPWELGRCSLRAGKRHVDARNVIWLGTSNVGHELVFEHHENRAEPDTRMSREDYLELTGILRPRVSHCLGASLVSRVTTVLPFVPFTLDEKKAIAAEAVYALAGDACKTLSPQDVESLVTKVLPSYHPSEGARSLHRAISNILVDAIS